jgi:hypothetical protein
MWQEILITDVTRMGGDRVCVAGLDHWGNGIRPILPYPHQIVEHDLYIDESSLIRPRAVVNLFVEPLPDCIPPHAEDHIWPSANHVEPLRHADDKVWRTILNQSCRPSVQDIFGTDLLHNNRNVAPGSGTRSLGTIKPKGIHQFIYKTVEYDGRPQHDYRLHFFDPDDRYFPIKVTDLTLQNYADYLHLNDGLSQAEVSEKLTRLFKRAEVFLRIGLTRPYEGWCWLQVNGIYTFPDYLAGRCFADFRL